MVITTHSDPIRQLRYVSVFFPIISISHSTHLAIFLTKCISTGRSGFIFERPQILLSSSPSPTLARSLTLKREKGRERETHNIQTWENRFKFGYNQSFIQAWIHGQCPQSIENQFILIQVWLQSKFDSSLDS